jgi:hypothetical protein
MLNPIPFPTEQLGPQLEAVVLEIHQETGVSISTIVTAILAVISLVVQGRIRVRKRHNLTSPTSLWYMGILSSGELKSAIAKRLIKGVQAFIDQQAEVHAVQLQEFETEFRAWKAEGKGILSAIQRKSAVSEPIEEEQALLKAHASRKPKKPKRYKLIHQRMTPQALQKNLSECFPTTSLLSDEAERVFKSNAVQDMAMLNMAFDGSDLISDLSSEGELIARDPCFTLALFTQWEILDAFLRGKGELARALGFLARCFVVAPQETTGFRSVVYSKPASDEILNVFFARCFEILEGHVSADPIEMQPKIELHFDNAAQPRWDWEHDNIQIMMRPGGMLQNDKDFGAKHADKIARMAAQLHFFDGNTGPIPLSTLERAISICNWYAFEFVRCFSKPPSLPQEQRDANLLLAWFANHLRTGGAFIMKKNEVRQCGPNQLRNTMRMNAALRQLWHMGCLGEGKLENEKGTFLFLNQQYFTPAQVMFLCSQPLP